MEFIITFYTFNTRLSSKLNKSEWRECTYESILRSKVCIYRKLLWNLRNDFFMAAT